MVSVVLWTKEARLLEFFRGGVDVLKSSLGKWRGHPIYWEEKEVVGIARTNGIMESVVPTLIRRLI